MLIAVIEVAEADPLLLLYSSVYNNHDFLVLQLLSVSVRVYVYQYFFLIMMIYSEYLLYGFVL